MFLRLFWYCKQISHSRLLLHGIMIYSIQLFAVGKEENYESGTAKSFGGKRNGGRSGHRRNRERRYGAFRYAGDGR